MTIPALSAKIRSKQLQSQFMKAYSELNQAARLAETREEMSVWDAVVLDDSMTARQSDRVLDIFMKNYVGKHKMTKTIWNVCIISSII